MNDESKALEELGKTLVLWDAMVRDQDDRLLFGGYYRWVEVDGKLSLVRRPVWKQQRMAEIYAKSKKLTITGRGKSDSSWRGLQSASAYAKLDPPLD